MNAPLADLWRELGYIRSAADSHLPPETTPLDAPTLRDLEEVFARRPEEVVRHFRRALGRPLTQDALRGLISEARVAIQAPEAYAQLLRARRLALAVFAGPLPDKHGIRIEPSDRRFQPIEDALGWLFSLAGPILLRLSGEFVPATLPRPDPKGSNFCYRMRKPNGDEHTAADSIRIALFSDWGTGRYFSRYIAQEAKLWSPDYGFHLGDVYYAGRPSEFAHYVTPDLDQLSDVSRVFVLNGNHEMYDGHEYFRYVYRRRQPSAPYLVPQEQEGSYFCLTSPNYLVIGIDTAYDWQHDGELRDTQQAEWLASRVIEGRQAGQRIVLLSQHEPFQLGMTRPTPLLEQVLSYVTVAGQCGIDYWFWGDEHYCALYRRSDLVPFVGCCVGHGGHPIYIQDVWRMIQDDQRGLYFAKAEWVEDAFRFPGGSPAANLANSGFCRLILAPSGVTVEFVDWYGNGRHQARI